jgi:hypothetical protein
VVVPKVRGRLLVSKFSKQKFDTERFNLNKLNDIKVEEQYRVEILNRCAALENSNDNVGIIALRNENVRSSAKDNSDHYELKLHKPQLDEECSELLDKRKGLNCSCCRI